MRDLVATCRGEWPKTSMCPLVGYSKPEQQLDRGGLAGAVRPEQAEHLAAPHLEVHVVHRARLGPAPEILEDLGQARARRRRLRRPIAGRLVGSG